MEIKAKNPTKPIVGVFMTTNDFFNNISNMDVNMPFFMYAEEAAEGLNRLNQQRIWQERPVGEVKKYDKLIGTFIDKLGADALANRGKIFAEFNSYGTKTSRMSSTNPKHSWAYAS